MGVSVKQTSETEPEVQTETHPQAGRVRLRGVLLGLLMVVVIIGMTQELSIRHSATNVGGGSPAPAPTYLLFFYMMFLAPLLGRWSRKLALTRGELLLIYAMMIVAGPIAHTHCIGYLIPHTVAPLYYNAQAPQWALFQPTLPSWFAPTDAGAIKAFFHGGDGTVPWGAWLVPMLAWSSMLITLFFVMLCLNVLIRYQWVEAERLTFPLVAIPLVLTEGARDKDTGLGMTGPGQALIALKQPLFWLGLLLPLLLQAPSAINPYIPSFPGLALQDIPLLNPAQMSPPWRGMGSVSVSLLFWLVGVAYLIPKEISFSCWFFYLMALLENVSAVWLGLSGEAPNVYSSDYPALYAQGAGAAFTLIGITLWMARRHLIRAARKALGNASSVDDRDEFLSYRVAFFGAVLGCVFLLSWLCLAGMRLWVAALVLALILGYFFIFARVRAETGLGMGVLLWPKMVDEVVITLVGAKSLRLADLTVLYALRWLYFGAATGSVMACQLESFKLADAGSQRGRRFGWTLALVALVTVPLAFAWSLHTYYAKGFEGMPIGTSSMVASQVYWAYQNLVESFNTASGPDSSGLTAMGAGALVTLALSGLRARFLWFPLHPVGFLAANSWGMHINWASFLLGWLCNVLVTRYGGLRLYRRLLPLFFGLIMGDLLHTGLWGVVTWATGGRTGV